MTEKTIRQNKLRVTVSLLATCAIKNDTSNITWTILSFQIKRPAFLSPDILYALVSIKIPFCF